MEIKTNKASRQEEADCSNFKAFARFKLSFFISLLLCVFCTNSIKAQDAKVNNLTTIPAGFESGETLFYRIYYKWGFIWKEAANGELFAERSVYEGNDVYKMSLSC